MIKYVKNIIEENSELEDTEVILEIFYKIMIKFFVEIIVLKKI